MRLHSQIVVRLVAAVAIAAAVSFPAYAHHGWGGYETKEFEITGIVSTPLELAGPHATMKIRVGDPIWDLTLAPPAQTVKSGLRDAKIPVGATVIIHGHRNVSPKNFEIKAERITFNGKTFNVYPDRT
jgi:hypothetical protein